MLFHFSYLCDKVAKFFDLKVQSASEFSVSEEKTNAFVLFFSRLFVTLQRTKLIKKTEMTSDRWTNIILATVALLLCALCVASIAS